MLIAKPSDKSRILEILMLAFEQNQSVNYIVKQDEVRLIRIRHLMKYALKICSAYGKVLVSEDGNGCALVLFPDKKRFSLRSMVWDIELVFRVIGLANILKVMRRENQIKSHHPSGPFYYLWFIGVHPVHKGLGTGSTLLDEIIADAKAMDRPIYLETSTLKNLPWYKKFGFEVYDKLILNYTLYFLKGSI
jgi:hypothetical protein